MGRRGRERARRATASEGPISAPNHDYADAEGNVLTLRGSLTPPSRLQYAQTLAGGSEREDAWQRATELLFERLAVSWTIAGLPITAQKELLARYRAARAEERRFVRDSLRAHVAAHFPGLQAP